MKENLDQRIKEEIDKLNLSIEEEAKAIVVWAFRNNPTLENIHSGEEADIPDKISRIKEKEMKEIMKYAVDQVNFYLWLKKNKKPVYNVLVKLGLLFTTQWDKPRNPWNMYQEFMKKIR